MARSRVLTAGATTPAGPVVVVGGANVDVKAQVGAPVVQRTSNPGTSFTSAGGVGRNIAENLARLGTAVELVAPVGDDPLGAGLRAETAAVGVGVDHLLATGTTGTYVAVLDAEGDLVVGVSSMAATETLTPEDLQPAEAVIRSAGLLVVDGNVPAAAFGWLLDLAAEVGVPVVVDPVSVAKAARLSTVLSPTRPLLALTPNVDELASLAGDFVADAADDIAAACAGLHQRGVRHLWVRRGAAGSVLCSDDGTSEVISPPQLPVVDVTGAGDAGTAGFVHALVAGRDASAAARLGQVVAALTCGSQHTVRPDLSVGLVEAALAGAGTRSDSPAPPSTASPS